MLQCGVCHSGWGVCIIFVVVDLPFLCVAVEGSTWLSFILSINVFPISMSVSPKGSSYTASPSLSAEVYPQSVLWLLKSPITILGMFLLLSGGSRNCSSGGLYTECTTTPGSSTVMNSTLYSSQTEMQTDRL